MQILNNFLPKQKSLHYTFQNFFGALNKVVFTSHPTNLHLHRQYSEYIQDPTRWKYSNLSYPTFEMHYYFLHLQKTNLSQYQKDFIFKSWLGLDQDRGPFDEKHVLLSRYLELYYLHEKTEYLPMVQMLSSQESTVVYGENEDIIIQNDEESIAVDNDLASQAKTFKNGQFRISSDDLQDLDTAREKLKKKILAAKKVGNVNEFIIADFSSVRQITTLQELLQECDFPLGSKTSVMPLLESHEDIKNALPQIEQYLNSQDNTSLPIKTIMKACSDATKRDGYAQSFMDNILLRDFANKYNLDFFLGTGTDISRGGTVYYEQFNQFLDAFQANKGAYHTIQGGQILNLEEFLLHFSEKKGAQETNAQKVRSDKVLQSLSTVINTFHQEYRNLFESSVIPNTLWDKQNNQLTPTGEQLDKLKGGARDKGLKNITHSDNLRAIAFQTLFTRILGYSSIFLEIGLMVQNEEKQGNNQKKEGNSIDSILRTIYKDKDEFCNVYYSFLKLACQIRSEHETQQKEQQNEESDLNQNKTEKELIDILDLGYTKIKEFIKENEGSGALTLPEKIKKTINKSQNVKDMPQNKQSSLCA